MLCYYAFCFLTYYYKCIVGVENLLYYFYFSRFLHVMPTLLRVYSNNQSNPVICSAIQFTCRQFYILHRKPFILQVEQVFSIQQVTLLAKLTTIEIVLVCCQEMPVPSRNYIGRNRHSVDQSSLSLVTPHQTTTHLDIECIMECKKYD